MDVVGVDDVVDGDDGVLRWQCSLALDFRQCLGKVYQRFASSELANKHIWSIKQTGNDVNRNCEVLLIFKVLVNLYSIAFEIRCFIPTNFNLL